MNTIGLDISQKTIDVTLHKTDESTYHTKVGNNREGLQSLKDWIKANKVRKCVIGMEATGIYYEAAAENLSETHTVYVINPLKIKDYGKSQFNRTKTDKADSNLIAEYTKRHADKIIPYSKPKNRYLQKLINLKQQLKDHQKFNNKKSKTKMNQALITAIAEGDFSAILNITSQLTDSERYETIAAIRVLDPYSKKDFPRKDIAAKDIYHHNHHRKLPFTKKTG